MREPGPLPFHWRNYIAILTASRLNCQYLVSIQEQEFILNGGDPRWLLGVSQAPPKLQNILRVIALLTHQPWLLTKDDVEPLLRGLDAWSVGELVHVVMLTCTFISLSGFVFGCGITPEIDIPEQQSSLDLECDDHAPDDSTVSVSASTEKVMELLKKNNCDNDYTDTDGGDDEERENEFANAGGDCSNTSDLPSACVSPGLSRYTGGIVLSHIDFDVKAKNYSIFRVPDYTWKEHGYEFISRFFSDVAAPLDEEFEYTYNMTDNMFHNNANVNTQPFRKAIWYYVQRVKGMFHDDYSYQQVNIYLNQPIKSFVKKLVCTPNTISQNDYQNLGINLRPDEKCHIALLAIESNKQATLLYGLHTVMMYMNR